MVAPEIWPMITYPEYLKKTGQKDGRISWKSWKMDVFGMSEREAIKAAYDPEWGWSPLEESAP